MLCKAFSSCHPANNQPTPLPPAPAQRSVLRLDAAAAALNAGQAVILAGGMTAAMLVAVLGPGGLGGAGTAGVAAGAAAAGAITAGDLVMIQGLLLQLWAPLQFLVRWRQGLGV